jgi:heme oxygenase
LTAGGALGVPPVLARLKRETAEQHARVEAMLPLLDAGLTRDAYRRVLAAFYGYHRPLEPALWSAPGLAALGLRAADRRKVPLLERDLRALGLDEAALAALPDCARLPDVRTLPHAVGCLYVLEGATLGGRVIERRLARTLGVDAARGGAFFASYGERVGPMWAAYRAAAARYVAEGGDEDAVVAAAVATFETLAQWMEASGPLLSLAVTDAYP